MIEFSRTVAGAVFASAISIASVSAHAESDFMEGVYIGGALGLSSFADSESEGGGVSVENSFDMGGAFAASVGKSFADGLRGEVEISYREADIDTFDAVSAGGTTINLGTGLNGDGSVSALAVLANVAYDFDTGTEFAPYLLGGIGLAQVTIDDARVAGVLLADDDDTVFAYQLGGGVAFDVSSELVLDAGYRFFSTADPSFTDSAGSSFDSELMTHNVMIGLRYSF
jgi:opacity protein-like surface antigen